MLLVTKIWEQRQLNEVTTRVLRKNKNLISKRPLTISAQYGLIDQQAFFNKQVASSNLENYLLLEKGEFAYNKSYSDGFPYGTIKKLNLYDNGAVSTLYIAFKANADINSDFLENLFSSNKWHNEVYKIAAEGARNHGLLNISPDDFFNIKITISKDSQEQAFISKFLRIFDNLLALYERKKELLKKFQQGFSDILFKKNPKECVSLGDYFYFNKGKNIGNKDLINNGKYYAIVYGELYTTYNYVISKVFSKTSIKGFKGRKNDLLFPSSSTVPFGTATCSALEIDNIELGNDIIVARPKNTNELDSAFISYQINSKRKILYPIISGTTITHMYSKDLSKIRIWLPNITTQNYISNILQRISHLNILVDKKVNILKEIKKEFLNTMFI